jgi:hypothetical protein
VLPRSHKNLARKAFERATKRVLPARHAALQRALAAEARSYGARVAELERRARGVRAAEPCDSDDVAENDRGADDIARSAVRACSPEGNDGTRLPRCLKVYVPVGEGPAFERPYAFAFEPAVGERGATLRFIAFGQRHPAPAHAASTSAPTSAFTAATPTNNPDGGRNR